MQYLVTHWPDEYGAAKKVWEIEELDADNATNVVATLGNAYYVYIDHVFDPQSDVGFALSRAEQLITKFIAEEK
jgi:hypothetical protein